MAIQIEGTVSPWNRQGIEGSPAFSDPPKVADCTLRDGEQQAGLVFSKDDKIAIAKRLDSVGVHELEIGTPAVSAEDREAIEQIASLGLHASLSALARARKDDIDLVARCGVQGVRISLPIGERQRRAKLDLGDEEYLRLAFDITAYAKSQGLIVIFSPYDTTRAELGLLERLLRMLSDSRQVDRVRLVDTAGAATPQSIAFLTQFMRETGNGLPIEVHCHNDLGLATSNTIAGALAGAAYLSVTVNGIGERAGNAALEEVVVALKILYGIDLGIRTEELCSLSAEVVARSGVALQPHKAVVGRNAFAHETGMVVAGLSKDTYTAEPYAPEIVGQTRSILMGKKSGRASVEYKLRMLGIEAAPDAIDLIVHQVKDAAISKRRALSDDEFVSVVKLVTTGS